MKQRSHDTNPQQKNRYTQKDFLHSLHRLYNMGSYDGITDKLFDIIHHKGAFYYGN